MTCRSQNHHQAVTPCFISILRLTLTVSKLELVFSELRIRNILITYSFACPTYIEESKN